MCWMEEYMNENVPIKISIDCYEKSDVILSVFFAFIDIFSIFFFILKIKSVNEKVVNLKTKLLKLFIIDFIARLLYTRKYSSWTFLKELFMTFMNTVQFYLIVSFILLNKSYSGEQHDSNKIYLICCIFFFCYFFIREYIFFIF